MLTTLKTQSVTKWTWSGTGFVRESPGEKQPAAPNCRQVYKRARYYDTSTGEFISRDPLEYVDGMSLYRGYFVSKGADPLGTNVYAIDGTWADESEDAIDSIRVGYSNVHKFYSETKEDKYYWGGPGTSGIAPNRMLNGMTGQDVMHLVRTVHAQICSDFCAKMKKCEDLEVNLVGWSRGAVAVVEVADWLNYYGCRCSTPRDIFKVRHKPIKVNFLGLFDPVEMVWTPTFNVFEMTIPGNVNFSYALWRTDEAVGIFPQKRYTNLSKEEDFWIHNGVVGRKSRSTHGQVGRHPDAYSSHVKPVAMANGVDF